MPDPPPERDQSSDTHLSGTTYKVYHYLLKQNSPVGISELQKGMGLSSPSVSQYHIRKLLRLGLVKEEQGGYVVDKVVLENVIRIRRVSIPFQTAYVAFFGVTLFILLAFLRPGTISSLYFFAVVINVAALGISILETRKTLKRL
jgi:DNA-binding transcriptional ArsR family regulator